MIVRDFLSSDSDWGDLSFLRPIFDVHGKTQKLDNLEDTKELLISEMALANEADFSSQEKKLAFDLVDEGYQIVKRHLPHIDDLKPVVCLLPRSKPSHLPDAWNSISAFACQNTTYSFLFREGDWKSVLKLNVIHELNHVARYPYSRPHEIFLDWLILEGLAGLFEIENAMSDYFLPGWTSVSHSDLLTLLPKVQSFWLEPEFMKDGKKSGEWFFGSASNGIPRYLGYSLGLFLVQQARSIFYPNHSWPELMRIPSHEWIRERV